MGKRFTLALNAAKNIDYMEKCFEQKLFIIKFPTKTQWTCIFIYPRGVIAFLKYYNTPKWKENFYIIPQTLLNTSVG